MQIEYSYPSDGQTVSTNSSVEVRKIDTLLKFKKVHPDAKLPTKNNASDVGFDVYSVENKAIPARGSAVVDVGLEFADISPNFWVKVEGRSGLGFKYGVSPHPGIIDPGYRSNAGIKLYNNTDTEYIVEKGDRIAQFVVYRNYNVIVEEGEIEESDRGANGFGSSGR
jgi:dUTP pyrophosphatase